MTEEKFSPQESLRLIQSMINKTKQDISDKSIYFLVWGWITFIACTGQFVLKHIYNYEKHYQVWWLVVVGIVFSVWHGIREEKTRKVKTYVGDSIKYLWIGMGICYFVLSAILSKIGWDTSVFPFFYYAVWPGHIYIRQFYQIPAIGDRGSDGLGTGNRVRLCCL